MHVASLLALAMAVALAHGQALLLVNKHVEGVALVAQIESSIKFSVFNTGSSYVETAYDVKLSDVAFESGNFELVSGSASASWELLPSGTNVTHTYVVRPLVPGYDFAPAGDVQYRQAADGAVIESKTSSFGRVFVNVLSTYDRLRLAQLSDWLKMAVVSAGPVAVPFLIYRFITSSYDNGLVFGVRKTKNA